MSTNMAYGFETQSTRLSTAISRRPGGRLTNGRLPLFHFHHQRRRRGFWSNRLSHELHCIAASLQNVAAQLTLPTLWRDLQSPPARSTRRKSTSNLSLDIAVLKWSGTQSTQRRRHLRPFSERTMPNLLRWFTPPDCSRRTSDSQISSTIGCCDRGRT